MVDPVSMRTSCVSDAGSRPEKPRMLLHSCCGPCSTSVISTLREDYELTVFFYNPNIHPEEEYIRRRDEQLRFIREFDDSITFIEGEYDSEAFCAAASGLESEPEGGSRCRECFILRLKRAAHEAAAGHFDFFTTTLTVSPHKNAALINEIGESLAAEGGVPWLHSDFKKKDGFLRSIRMSKEYGLYRQNYCGCIFSLKVIE